jgi:hypothetical protein
VEGEVHGQFLRCRLDDSERSQCASCLGPDVVSLVWRLSHAYDHDQSRADCHGVTGQESERYTRAGHREQCKYTPTVRKVDQDYNAYIKIQ